MATQIEKQSHPCGATGDEDTDDAITKRRRVSPFLSPEVTPESVQATALHKFSQWLLTYHHISVLEQDLLSPFLPPPADGNGEAVGAKPVQLSTEDVQFLRGIGFLQHRIGSLSASSLSSACSGVLYSLSHPRVRDINESAKCDDLPMVSRDDSGYPCHALRYVFYPGWSTMRRPLHSTITPVAPPTPDSLQGDCGEEAYHRDSC